MRNYLARLEAACFRPHGGLLRQARPSAHPGRDHNPGDIRDGPFAYAQPGYSGYDGRFATLATDDARASPSGASSWRNPGTAAKPSPRLSPGTRRQMRTTPNATSPWSAH